jgi:hypothetical protein
MKILRRLGIGLVVLLLSAGADGNIIWDYYSAGGGSTLSGELTTTGTPGDELVVGNTFSVLSIDTVVVDGVDITPSENWKTEFGGQAPPFADFPTGVLTLTAPYIAVNQSPTTLVGAGDAALNGVAIASPGQGQFSSAVFQAGDGFIPHTEFTPSETTFTATSIPEPSVGVLVGFAALLMARRRRVVSGRHSGRTG